MITKFKIFEELSKWKKDWTDDINKNHKIGTIVDSYDILDYVRTFHDKNEEINDDFYERIVEPHEYFKVKIINIDDIPNLDGFYIDEEFIDEYIEYYKENKNYPLPVLDYDYYIIDGTHRLHALNELGIKKVKCYVGYQKDYLYEKYNLEKQYMELFGVPKNTKQKEHMRKWIEEAKKNNTIEKSTEEVERQAFTGDLDLFYRTMENTYEDVPELDDQDLIDFYKSKNNIETDEDINRMLAWFAGRKKSRHHTPEPNFLGKEQDQIPSNKDYSKQSSSTGSGRT